MGVANKNGNGEPSVFGGAAVPGSKWRHGQSDISILDGNRQDSDGRGIASIQFQRITAPALELRANIGRPQ